MASMSDMIVKPIWSGSKVTGWRVERGSRQFWVTHHREDWVVIELGTTDALDVSDDLSGSLEYIEDLFR